MNWRKLGWALLFPHPAVLALVIPAAAVGLTGAMLYLKDTDPLRIGAYVLAFYALVAGCARVPRVIGRGRQFKRENRYLRRWSQDPRLRANVTLSGNVLWNGAYSALQLGLGIYHRSAWFYSLAAYYGLLAAMRLDLVRHTLRHEPGEKMARELRHYRGCGWVFLGMNLALSGMMFYMIRENRLVRHHEITTIAMAAYTFTTLTMAIVNVIRYRKYNSPALSAGKAISLAAAGVSMLTLESTMLATFGEEMAAWTRVAFLGLSGGAVAALIVVMAIYMIVEGNRKLQRLET